jgi:hypothetical protein
MTMIAAMAGIDRAINPILEPGSPVGDAWQVHTDDGAVKYPIVLGIYKHECLCNGRR